MAAFYDHRHSSVNISLVSNTMKLLEAAQETEPSWLSKGSTAACVLSGYRAYDLVYQQGIERRHLTFGMVRT